MRAFTVVACLGVFLTACVPTAARKNARIEHGVDVDLTAGMQYVPAGENDTADSSETDQVLHLEVDVQYAHKSEDGSAFAGQLKIPISIVFTTLDFYYQLPENNSRWFFGFGAEVGALAGLYVVATHYLDDNLYVSLTPRVLNAESEDQQAVLINPQLSFGLNGQVDLSAFINFAHHTGEGFDFDVDLFGEDDGSDYRKNFWLIGGSVRF